MLRLSQAQSQAIVAAHRANAIMMMCEHCRVYFENEVAHFTQAELTQQVEACLLRAKKYHLTSRRDCYHFLNLALEYGWSFDTDISLSWMRNYLTDKRVDSPSERLELLVKRCITRQKIEEQNRAMRQEFSPREAAKEENIFIKVAQSSDYIKPINSTLLLENVLPYFNSKALQEMEDAAVSKRIEYEDDEENDDRNEESYYENDNEPLMLTKQI